MYEFCYFNLILFLYKERVNYYLFHIMNTITSEKELIDDIHCYIRVYQYIGFQNKLNNLGPVK